MGLARFAVAALLLRYESFGDARVLRSVPSFFRPSASDRITERLRFPPNTRLRFTAARAPI
jgi:hypothetical protein